MNNREEKNIITVQELREKILIEADKFGASDIHIDPAENEYIIRLRIDGILQIFDRGKINEYENIISHFKVLSGLDITKRVLPQEGHFLWLPSEKEVEGKKRVLNIRVSFFPTVYGEAAVLRLLNRENLLIDLKDFELGQNNLKLIKNFISRSYGMILVSGTAGSGKTVMLYSMLNELVNDNKNIVTLEDPVEYYLSHVRQSQINPDRDYTFATGIRSILRQDPDIIMVGEIRDLDTAENAVRVSLTGRLLFSTLHASSSIGTISRLLDMKVERSILAYALIGVVNRRLVRKICEKCKTPYNPPLSSTEALGMSQNEQYFHGRGCKECNDGFKGRLGLFEVLGIDEDIRLLIIGGASSSEIQKKAKEKGLKTLQEDGIEKIRAGLTTPEEVLKATA